MKVKILYPLTILLLLSACSIQLQQKSHKINKSLNKGTASINKAIKEVNRDWQSLGQLATILKGYEAKNTTVMSALKEYQPLMQQAKNAMDTKQKKIAVGTKNIQEIISGKKRVKSNSPDWDILNALIDQQEANYDSFEDSYEEYSEHRDDFLDIAKDNGVFQVSGKKLHGEWRQLVKKNNSEFAHIKRELTKAKAQVEQETKKGRDLERLEGMLAKIAQLTLLMDDAETAKNKLVKQVDELIAKTENKARVWQVPGMESYALLDKIKALQKDLNVFESKYNKLSQSLN